jgi:hypothetical protein
MYQDNKSDIKDLIDIWESTDIHKVLRKLYREEMDYLMIDCINQPGNTPNASYGAGVIAGKLYMLQKFITTRTWLMELYKEKGDQIWE